MCIIYTRIFNFHNIKWILLEITARHYGTSTEKFDNHVFKSINKNNNVNKEPYFKVFAFMAVNNENKLLL